MANRKCWEVYLCDKDFYPTELKNLKLIELTENHKIVVNRLMDGITS